MCASVGQDKVFEIGIEIGIGIDIGNEIEIGIGIWITQYIKIVHITFNLVLNIIYTQYISSFPI